MSIKHAVTPLRMIFWGGLLCVFDFTISQTTSINGRPASGFRFDILNDFVGLLLITIGVSKLSAFAIDPTYRSWMRYVFVCGVLNCIQAFSEHFVFRSPTILQILWNLVGLASLCATVMFCTCMHRLSSAYALHQSAASWLLTRKLVIILWVIPLGLLDLVFLVSLITQRSFNINLGIFGLALLFVFVIPWIFLFKSTSRMQSEAEQLGEIPTG